MPASTIRNFLPIPSFYIENLCNQRSALCNYRPAELAVYMLSGRKANAGNQSIEIILKSGTGILIGVVIINSKTSPTLITGNSTPRLR